MTKRTKNTGGRNSPRSSPTALDVITQHCSTIRDRGAQLQPDELSTILDAFVHELNDNITHLSTYFNSLIEIVSALKSTFPPVLLQISSHYFFTLIRNTIRDILLQLYKSHQLNDQEIYVLRICILLFSQFVNKLSDVSRILHWITEETFLSALTKCLNQMHKIPKDDENHHIVRQITRLLNMFSIIQERLPIPLHHALFLRICQATANCLTSEKYLNLFNELKFNANSMTDQQKLFLVECPRFIAGYNGPRLEETVENVSDIMLARYVSILNKHMKTIKQWNHSMMYAIHNLIITIVYSDEHLAAHTNNSSYRSLIRHLLNLLNEATIIDRIQSDFNQIETLLIYSTLAVLNKIITESDALDYIRKRQPAAIFRRLIKIPHQSISLYAYMLLVYTTDHNDIRTSTDDRFALLSVSLNLLQNIIEVQYQKNATLNKPVKNIDKNLIQVTKTLKILVEYDEVVNSILAHSVIPFLIIYYNKVHELSKQVLLECFWRLSFNEKIAQQLRQHPQFIIALQNITEATRVSTTNDDLGKVADGLLWKLVQEPKRLAEKMKEHTDTNDLSSKKKYKYDMMISYSDQDKQTASKIEQLFLRQGFRVWFNREQSKEHVMEVVAEAIENSEFIVPCISKAYKRDNRCHAEAEYALNSKCSLLPWILQGDYKPDGWLNSIIQSRIYTNFDSTDFSVVSALFLKKLGKEQSSQETPFVKPIGMEPVNTSYTTKNFPSNEPPKPTVSSPLDASVDASAQKVASSISKSETPADILIAPSIVSVEPQPTDIIYSHAPTAVASLIADKEQLPQIQKYNTLPSSKSRFISSDKFVNGNENHRRIDVKIIPKPRTTDTVSSAEPSSLIPNQPPNHTVPSSTDPNVPTANTIIVDKQERTEARPAPRPSTFYATYTTEMIDVKKPQVIVQAIPPSTVSNIVSNVAHDKQKTRVEHVVPTTTKIDSLKSVNTSNSKQSVSIHSISRSSIRDSIPAVASINEDNRHKFHSMRSVSIPSSYVTDSLSATSRQQKTETLRPNMKTKTRPTIFDTALVNSTPSTSSSARFQEQPHLPAQYTNRQVFKPVYDDISPEEWKNDDVLDFLFDSHLYTMMPLCESISGKALIRLFRICQTNPSHFYDQLNGELRTRFQGLTLPVRVYTQFLALLDGLVAHLSDKSSTQLSSYPKAVGPNVFVPPIIQQQATETRPNSSFSKRSKITPDLLMNMAPDKTTKVRTTRIIERVIVRPTILPESKDKVTMFPSQPQHYAVNAI